MDRIESLVAVIQEGIERVLAPDPTLSDALD